MEIDMDLPLDNDGFLRRECPHCQREFKWHDGPANEEAEGQEPFEVFHCPLCGQAAGPDSWWTHAQLDLVDGTVEARLDGIVDDMLDDAFKGLKGSKHVKITRSTSHRGTPPGEPAPLVEPDDMSIVASPCHAWEPVKVPDDTTGPFYCLVCGSAFAV